MKTWIKKQIVARPAWQFLLPVGQWVLGLPYRCRNAFFREILRLRLFRLWLVQRQPLLLFARFGGIGDILCSLPAYEAVCRANPGALGVYITLTEFQSLPGLAQAPGVVCPSRRFCSIPQFPRWLVAQAFVPYYADERGQPNLPGNLAAQFYRACGLVPVPARPRFRIGRDWQNKIREALKLRPDDATRTVVIHTGPTWPVKEWPVAHWQALVAGLQAAGPARIFQIGANRNCNLGQIQTATLRGVESLLDQLSLADMAALLTVADLFIGIDSGMLHLAEAAGTPSIGLFGPTDPARIFHDPQSVGLWHALPCSFCHHRQPRLHHQTGCPHGIACMAQLRPESVLAQCQARLKEPRQKLGDG